LGAIDVQVSKEEFYKAKKAEKRAQNVALAICGIFGENGIVAIGNEVALEKIVEETKVVEEEPIASIKDDANMIKKI
jgi:hypothetical protein